MNIQDRWRWGSRRALLLVVVLSSSSLACSGGDEADAIDVEPLEGTMTAVPPRPDVESTPPPSGSIDSTGPAREPPADASPGRDDAEADAIPSTDGSMARDELSFATDVWPIFNGHCGPCHESYREGGHNVGSDDVEISLEAALAFKALILRDLSSGSMPPGCGGGSNADACISAADLAVIRSWFAAGSPP